MKKKIGIILLIIIAVVAGFVYLYFNKTDKETENLEKKIDKASRDYFEKYVSANDSVNAYKITLEDLEKANQTGENYDLKGLEKCDKKETYADVTINYQTGKAKKTQVNLKC